MKPLSQFQKFILSILLYVAVFYNQEVGVNFSLLCLFVWALSYAGLAKEKQTKGFWLLSFSVFISAIALAWYGDPLSFFSLFIAIFAIGIYTQYNEIKFITYPVLAAYSFVSFIVRIFFVNQWLPQGKINNKTGKKMVAYFFIPALLVTLFICIYAASSDMFDSFFKNIHFDFNMEMIVFLSISGFYFMFNYWFMMPPKLMLELNKKLNDHLTNDVSQEPKPTFEFLEIDFERRSGEISLILLNILLLVFLITYNYEQFGRMPTNSGLSGEVHQRINSLIVSIVMAVSVIMFYFKSVFNFDPKAKRLKQLAYCWIALNLLLVASAFSKNTEYIYHSGLTFKRIGVYIFLFLSITGLVLTYFKIKNKRANSYLISKMFIAFFVTLVANCPVNWSWVVTQYNLTYTNNENGNYRYLQSLDFNKQLLYRHFKNDADWKEYFKDERSRVDNKKQQSFLSKSFYYDNLDLN